MIPTVAELHPAGRLGSCCQPSEGSSANAQVAKFGVALREAADRVPSGYGHDRGRSPDHPHQSERHTGSQSGDVPTRQRRRGALLTETVACRVKDSEAPDALARLIWQNTEAPPALRSGGGPVCVHGHCGAAAAQMPPGARAAQCSQMGRVRIGPVDRRVGRSRAPAPSCSRRLPATFSTPRAGRRPPASQSASMARCG